MGWIMSQDDSKMVFAREIMLENNSILVNGILMGRYSTLSDAISQMQRIWKWINDGCDGVFSLDKE